MGEYQRGLARSRRDLPVDVTMVARQKTGSARIGGIEHLGASKRPRALTLYLENPFGENLFDHPRALARCVIGLVRKGVRGREDGEWKYGRQARADRSQKSATHWAPLSRCDLTPRRYPTRAPTPAPSARRNKIDFSQVPRFGDTSRAPAHRGHHSRCIPRWSSAPCGLRAPHGRIT